ncbi:hypothetical protein EVAR_44749_1 [Eumeta japonica]|uniref:Uncharacterized protein n=1 Tax=Eumeta variegata TaxID=151549 RepID=A0A4C1XJM5_EUMVA|nr:hypothetical protein EVAR_44749_1 [Eumeta japonica]
MRSECVISGNPILESTPLKVLNRKSFTLVYCESEVENGRFHRYEGKFRNRWLNLLTRTRIECSNLTYVTHLLVNSAVIRNEPSTRRLTKESDTRKNVSRKRDAVRKRVLTDRTYALDAVHLREGAPARALCAYHGSETPCDYAAPVASPTEFIIGRMPCLSGFYAGLARARGLIVFRT